MFLEKKFVRFCCTSRTNQCNYDDESNMVTSKGPQKSILTREVLSGSWSQRQEHEQKHDKNKRTKQEQEQEKNTNKTQT
jgi:hypothetical protein